MTQSILAFPDLGAPNLDSTASDVDALKLRPSGFTITLREALSVRSQSNHLKGEL